MFTAPPISMNTSNRYLDAQPFQLLQRYLQVLFGTCQAYSNSSRTSIVSSRKVIRNWLPLYCLSVVLLIEYSSFQDLCTPHRKQSIGQSIESLEKGLNCCTLHWWMWHQSASQFSSVLPALSVIGPPIWEPMRSFYHFRYGKVWTSQRRCYWKDFCTVELYNCAGCLAQESSNFFSKEPNLWLQILPRSHFQNYSKKTSSTQKPLANSK